MGIVFGVVILIIFINHLSVRLGFEHLSYSVELSKETAEIDEEVTVYSTVENRKLMTVSFLNVIETFPEGFESLKNKYTLFVLPFQRVRKGYLVKGFKRGLHQMKISHLELGDFIGLNKTSQFIEPESSIVILPQRINLADHLEPIGSLNGDWSVKRWILEDPLMTIGLREYTGNEPRKYIHWPSTARHGQMMVRQFDFTTDQSVMIVLNCESMKPCWKPIEVDLIEHCISIARGLMELFEKEKIPYGFITNARSSSQNRYYAHPGLGAHHLNHLVYQLGILDYRLVSFFEPLVDEVISQKGHYTSVVIITPRLLETYLDPINALNKSVVKTTVVSVEEDHINALSPTIVKVRGA